MRFITLLGFVVALASCNKQKSLTPNEGFIDVTGGKVWYRINGSGTKPPILLLHGGPGSSSYYLDPLKALSKDRPVIFIDQLGCGRSTHHFDDHRAICGAVGANTESAIVKGFLSLWSFVGHYAGDRLLFEISNGSASHHFS
jgi:proline iminopeptidase